MPPNPAKKPKPNISDVARAAGVSIATVSYVINKSRFVSDEVAQKVHQAIDELGYIPSSIARGLANKQSRIIGVVFSDISNPFFTSIYMGIESVLSEEGYELILINTGEIHEKQELALKTMLSRQIDGLIIAPTGKKSRMLNHIVDSGIPVVIIDRETPIKKASLIDIDNTSAAFEAVSHLIQDGYYRIGAILGLADLSTTRNRLEGYKKALTSYSIPYRQDYVIYGKSRLQGGYLAAKELLSLPQPPQAIFAANNLMTTGALRAFRELGVNCPAEIGIFGFDDIELGDIVEPPLSTVWQPTFEIGARAAKVLLENTKTLNITHEQLKASLIIRGSCSTNCYQRYAIENQQKIPSPVV